MVGGDWRLAAIGSGWRLVVVGGWRLVVGGAWGWSLAKKKIGFLKDPPGGDPVLLHDAAWCCSCAVLWSRSAAAVEIPP